MTRHSKIVGTGLFQYALAEGGMRYSGGSSGNDGSTTFFLHKKMLASSPNLAKIFSDIATAPADADRSVLSPAAYFVDLMRFVQDFIESKNEIGAFAGLESRRPDLKAIPLDGSHTEGTMPYTRMVNRIILASIAEKMRHESSTDDLGDFDVLANVATFASSSALPYDAKLHEIRAFMDHLGWDFAETLGKLGVDWKTIALERLGLDHVAVNRLTGGYTAVLMKTADDSMVEHSQLGLDEVMSRLEVTREQIERLLGPAIVADDPETRAAALKKQNIWQGIEEPHPRIIAGRGLIATALPSDIERMSHQNAGEFVDIFGEGYYSFDDEEQMVDGIGKTQFLARFPSIHDSNNGTNGTRVAAVLSSSDGQNADIYEFTEDRSTETLVHFEKETLEVLERRSILARTLGWDYDDLDWAYWALSYLPADKPDLFAEMAEMAQLAKETELSFDDVAALVAPIRTITIHDDDGAKSHFDRLFSTSDFINALPENARTGPAISNADEDYPSGRLAASYKSGEVLQLSRTQDGWIYAEALAAAFEPSEHEIGKFADFIAKDILGSEVIPLDVGALTMFHRLNVLPEILDLDPAATIDLLRLVGHDIVTNGLIDTTVAGTGPDAWTSNARQSTKSSMHLIKELKGMVGFLADQELTTQQLAFVSGQIKASGQFGPKLAFDAGYDPKDLTDLESNLFNDYVAPKSVSLTQNKELLSRFSSPEAADSVMDYLQDRSLIDENGHPIPQNVSKQKSDQFLIDVQSAMEDLFAILIEKIGIDGNNIAGLMSFGIVVDHVVAPKLADLTDLDVLDALEHGEPPVVLRNMIATLRERLDLAKTIFALLTSADSSEDVVTDYLEEGAKIVGLPVPVFTDVMEIVKQALGDKYFSPTKGTPSNLQSDLIGRLVYAIKTLKLGAPEVKCLAQFPQILRPISAKDDPHDLSLLDAPKTWKTLYEKRDLISLLSEEQGSDEWSTLWEAPYSIYDELALDYGCETDAVKSVGNAVIGAIPELDDAAPIDILSSTLGILDLAEDMDCDVKVAASLLEIASNPLVHPYQNWIVKELWFARLDVQDALEARAKSNASAADWPKTRDEIIAPCEDKLRDVLTSLMLQSLRGSFRVTEDYGPVETKTQLYEYLLVDVEAEGVTRISPIKQALNSLQLYVHRCRMGQEKSVKTPIPEKPWSWMENYRVWEANRRVFLFPEAYLHPTLRKDKSPQFKAFESALLQSRHDDAGIQKAVAAYLSDAEALAKLQITAACGSEREDGSGLIDLYFLGTNAKSDGTDYSLRHAVMDNSQDTPQVVLWDPWVPINAHIKSSRPSIIFAQGRLFIFWAEPELRKDSEDGKETRKTLYSSIKYTYQNAQGTWARPQVLMPTTMVSDSQQRIQWDVIKNTKKDGNNPETNIVLPEILAGLPMWKGLSLGRESADGDIVISYGDETLEFDGARFAPSSDDLKVYGTRPFRAFRLSPEQVVSATDDITEITKPYSAGNYDMTTIGEGVTDAAHTTPVRCCPGLYAFDNGDDAYLFAKRKNADFEAIHLIVDPDRAGDLQANLFPPSDLDLSRESPIAIIPLSTNGFGPLGRRLLAEGLSGLFQLEAQQTSERWFVTFRTEGIVFLPDSGEAKEGGADIFARIGPGPLAFSGAFGSYYWEIFFQMPMLIAKTLNAENRFEAALTWYKRVFDPGAPEDPVVFDDYSDNDRVIDSREHFWRFVPFRTLHGEQIKEMLTDPMALHVYREDPVDPQAIARLRPDARRRSVVMHYIDNLLDWGDALFGQATWESLGEARMIYIMARDLLGERPVPAGKADAAPPLTYEALMALEGAPLHLDDDETEDDERDDADIQHAFDLRDLKYFSIPENKVFLDYWDRVDDRLDKLRHGKSISGKDLDLDLFAPEIDPNKLVGHMGDGAGGGLGAITQIPTPHYKFKTLIQNAKSVASSLTTLGSKLAGVLERGDTETLMLQRDTHEKLLLKSSEEMLKQRLKDAEANLAALRSSATAAQERASHYSGLLGVGSSGGDFVFQDASSLRLNDSEQTALNELGFGLDYLEGEMMVRIEAVVAHLIPTVFGLADGDFQPGSAIAETAAVLGNRSQKQFQSSQYHNTQAQFERRQEEWQLQRSQALNDLAGTNHQIEAAKARVQAARQEILNHLQTAQNNEQILEFLAEKFTAQELYVWSAEQLSLIYGQTYKLAVELGRTAQAAFAYELDKFDVDYFDKLDWAAERRGLYAGEHLMLALEQMEAAFYANDVRRLEIEKTVSLADAAPEALLELRNSGMARFSLTEAMFDRDFPGHYCRKIETVSVNILAMVGPYQNVHATLRQTDQMVVMKEDVAVVEAILDPSKDHTRVDGLRNMKVEKQAIALSKGVDDSGVFHLSFNDERYNPFEGTGAVSSWTLEMPKASNRIDLGSISDVVVKIRYTALAGSDSFADEVRALGPISTYRGIRLISLRNEYADAWRNRTSGALEFALHPDLFPTNVDTASLTVGEAAADGKGGKVKVIGLSGDSAKLVKLRLNKAKVEPKSGTVDAPEGYSTWVIEADGDDNLGDLKDILVVLHFECDYL